MSDMPKEDQQSLKELGSVLLASLSKDALRILSLAYDCGYLDTIMDKEVNPKVAKYFPEEFSDPDLDDDIVLGIIKEEAAKILKKSDEAEEKDCSALIDALKSIADVGCDDIKDALEDIDDSDVADKLILEGEGFELDTYGSEF